MVREHREEVETIMKRCTLTREVWRQWETNRWQSTIMDHARPFNHVIDCHGTVLD